MYVVGFVGPFGSGCTFISNLIVSTRGYTRLSLSDFLRALYRERNEGGDPTRAQLQDFGDEIRKDKGCEYLAVLAFEKMKEDTAKNYVVDSIRNPAEAEYLRRNIPQFCLFGVFADPSIRFSRVLGEFERDRRIFEREDDRDSNENFAYGQKVTSTFRRADIIIINNREVISGNEAYNQLVFKINRYIDIIEGSEKYEPNPTETYMAAAYAVSMRSTCSQRKVGAVIIDAQGTIFSSGFNNVPETQLPCQSQYGGCYRARLKNEFREGITGIISDAEEKKAVYNLFKEKFKILDYCRALHAEENAILGVARLGSSKALEGATLFSSTYPCNMCALKIAQVGIKKVVYFEPYPMEEAKRILAEKGVVQEPFEGVTYNGYFRFMEVVD
ncbi:MAG: deaminase [Clostridiaceae bacterium]